MPMSRALAKLAVATDLGTAARPSTAAPGASGPAGTAGGGAGSGGGSGKKSGMATASSSSRPLLLKPSAARSALTSLPLPLSSLEHGNRAQAAAAAPTSAAGAAGSGSAARSGSATGPSGGSPAAASGVLVASPTTPRLPPLPTHSPPPPPPPPAAAATGSSSSSQLPPATSPAMAQQWASLHSHPHPHPHPYMPTSPPLPPCGGPHLSSSSGSRSDIGKELREATRNHPGLPASLLAQLHHPRRPGAPSSAPFMGASAAAVAAPPPPPGGGGGAAASTAGVRPSSPRSRARMTTSLVNGYAAAVAAQPHQLTAPPPAAISALSPDALAVLLGTPSQPPPPTPGCLLMARRTGPTAGAALRPSTAQQGCGVGGSTSAAGRGASPGTAGGASRPPVMPHSTVPYKPGSIRLPPGGVPGLTAAVALGGPGKGSSGPGSRAGSGTGSPVVPAAAATATAAASASELLRPWTSASAGCGALRPTTASPLTHCMPTDTSSALVVRVPRPATEAHVAPPLGGVPPSLRGCGGSGGGGSSYSAGRTAQAARSVSAASAPSGTAASAPGATTGSGGGGGGCGRGQEGRQLTAQELRAVVVALATARPEAAAMLLQRPATAAADALGRPASGVVHRPATSANCTRGSVLSDSGISVGVGIRDPSVYDDKWPRPNSGASRPSSRGAATAAAAAAPTTADSSSRGGSSGSRRQAISAWGSTTQTLQPIPEDGELSDGEEALGDVADGGGGGGLAESTTGPLQPLEPLDPDPDLDASWASIVASNQRPDTAAARASSRGINVFSRPATGALRVARQAAPMVLVVEDITASTPEVLERELEALSLEQLQTLQAKLCVRGP